MRNYHFRHTGVLFPVTLIPVAAYKAALRVQSERSERLRELTPAARRRGLYFIDKCGGVLFPVALTPGAGYKVSLRVQSERSERLRELTPAARRRCCFKASETKALSTASRRSLFFRPSADITLQV